MTLIAVNRHRPQWWSSTDCLPGDAGSPRFCAVMPLQERRPETPHVTKPPDDSPFWKRKTLAEMTAAEWESVCDGCGRCCLNKLEDEDTGEIYYTDVGCELLDFKSCRCCNYEHRSAQVEDCVQLTPANVGEISWLPPTCGYRLLTEGRDLYWWHPLVSGDPASVHTAGISVSGKVSVRETDEEGADLENHIVDWPVEIPSPAAKIRRGGRR
jgi:uncharacterized protein